MKGKSHHVWCSNLISLSMEKINKNKKIKINKKKYTRDRGADAPILGILVAHYLIHMITMMKIQKLEN